MNQDTIANIDATVNAMTATINLLKACRGKNMKSLQVMRNVSHSKYEITASYEEAGVSKKVVIGKPFTPENMEEVRQEAKDLEAMLKAILSL